VIRAALVAVAAALILPVSAQAALSFVFGRAQARPGQRVHAFQADPDGNPAPAWEKLDGVTIYLARLSNIARRVRLGPMGIDANGVWSIDFRVPQGQAGSVYDRVLCRPCGNTYFSSALPGTPWTGKPSGVLKVRR